MEPELYVTACEHNTLDLYLSHEPVRKLVAAFAGLTRVTYQPSLQLSSLQFLDLSHNRLGQDSLLPAFADVTPALLVLKLGHNRLTSLACVARLASLRELWAHGNRLPFLEAVVDDLRLCPALRQLTLQDNPCTQHAIVATDLEAPGMDGDGEGANTAASRRRVARVEAVLAAVTGHLARAHAEVAKEEPGGDGSGVEAKRGAPATPTGAARPPGVLDLWLAAALPSLRLLVTGAPPCDGGAVAAGGGATGSLRGDTLTSDAAGLKSTSFSTARPGAGPAGRARRTAGPQPTKEYAAAAASLCSITTAGLLAGRAWVGDTGAGGGQVWLELVREAQRSNAAAAAAKSAAAAVGPVDDGSGDVGAEPGDATAGAAAAGGGRRVPDIAAARARVPGHVVPKRPGKPWQAGTAAGGTVTLAATTTEVPRAAPEGEGLAAQDVAEGAGGTAEGQPGGTEAAGGEGATAEGIEPGPSATATTQSTPAPAPVAAGPVQGLRTLNHPLPKLDHVRPSVPTRFAGPLKPHQKWRAPGDEETAVEGQGEGGDGHAATTSAAEGEGGEASPAAEGKGGRTGKRGQSKPGVPRQGAASSRPAGQRPQSKERGKDEEGKQADGAGTAEGEGEGGLGATGGSDSATGNVEGEASKPAPAAPRKPDLANVKATVPSRVAPPLKPHQKWNKDKDKEKEKEKEQQDEGKDGAAADSSNGADASGSGEPAPTAGEETSALPSPATTGLASPSRTGGRKPEAVTSPKPSVPGHVVPAQPVRSWTKGAGKDKDKEGSAKGKGATTDGQAAGAGANGQSEAHGDGGAQPEPHKAATPQPAPSATADGAAVAPPAEQVTPAPT